MSRQQMFASYVQSAFGVYRALSENFTQVMVMGLAAPFAFALVWFILLFCFAGFIIIMALLLFLAALIATAGYFYYKAGWVSVDAIQASVTGLAQNTSLTSTDDMSQIWYAVLAVLATISVIMYVVFLVLSRTAIARCIAIG